MLDLKTSIIQLIPKKHQLAWAVGLVMLFLATYYGYFALDAYQNARRISGLAEPLAHAAASRDWAGASNLLDAAQAHRRAFDASLDKLYPLTLLPVISGEARAARFVSAAGALSLDSASSALAWVQGVPLLAEADFNSFSELTEQDKAAFLKEVSDSTALWEKIGKRTQLSLSFLEDARNASRLPFVNSQVSQITDKLLLAQTAFAQISPWIALSPGVLGYPSEKTYLILLQNNTELRPTGGFIGTYGVLKIRNAEVVSFTTDNVYNLDEPAKAYNEKVPPLPLQRYIKQSQWFFRDSNWDPDFPTSARRAIQFYKDERGPVREFDGVIALTPAVVEDLMAVLGPVSAEGREFTADNLIELLAYHVELGFREEGITIYNRKQIIDDVAQQLKEKVFSMSVDELRLLIPVVLDNLEERQLMAYFDDAATQALAERHNWAGQIVQTRGDYVFVVDANLGSLKSDPAISRSIGYKVDTGPDGRMAATVSATYEHTGDFDWKTTRYRTYTRIYVPRGSTLVSVSGNEEPVAISDEHGKTVFGTFISIEPLSAETLTYTYTLPRSISEQAALGEYSLYLQKQGGATPHDLAFDISVPFKINRAELGGSMRKESSARVLGTWSLSEDRTITLSQ